MRIAKFIAATVFLSTSLMTLSAQTAVTTTGGTSGTVPVFTGSATVGNSVITQSNGNVGVGATTPVTTLDVNGVISSRKQGAAANLAYQVNGNGGWAQPNLLGHWWTGSQDAISLQVPGNISNSAQMVMLANGNVGIGTTSPASNSRLDVEGGMVKVGTGYSQQPAQALLGTGSDGHSVSIFPSLGAGNYNNIVQAGDQGIIYSNGSAGTGALVIAPNVNGVLSGIRMDQNGNVGIGVPSPGTKLEVNGGIRLTSGSGGGMIFADGSVQTVAYPGPVSCGGDYAESVDVTGTRNAYEPGDVLVLSSDDSSDVAKSAGAYSTAVVGVFSTKPGYVGRRQLGEKSAQEVPMAMIGIVPVKVSAENGSIRRGDMLVTASLPGYAMKGTDREKMLGAVIGKALGHLDSGTGVIEVVITLQ